MLAFRETATRGLDQKVAERERRVRHRKLADGRSRSRPEPALEAVWVDSRLDQPFAVSARARVARPALAALISPGKPGLELMKTQLGGVVWEFVRMERSIPALDSRE
jgi:hypothetical protein